MSFAAALESLNALGLELAPGSPRRKFDLAHMRTLAHALGDPQTNFPSVLIAGTNGKGSTAATLASILAAAGYRTGLYTSPHLQRVTERIRIGGHQPSTINHQPLTFSEIPEPDFARLYFLVDETGRSLVTAGRLPHPPSYFETLTALAFLHFAERNVDIAILEVGLGGRLDATNIVSPLLSIITDIALDHQEYLGPTIAAIAREKAGILRPGGTLITLPQHPQANQAIGEVAHEIAATTGLPVHAINAAPYLPGRDFGVSAGFSPREAAPKTLSSRAETQASACAEVEGPASESQPSSGAPSKLRLGGVEPKMEDAVIPSGAALAAESRDPRISSSEPPPLPPNSYDLHIDNQTLYVRSPLPGEHQQRNIALAIAAAIELRNHNRYESDTNHAIRNHPGYNIPNSAIEAGIAHTSWPCRLEFLPPNLLLDVAHNPAGAWTLRAAIASLHESRPRTLLFSCLRDKDLREIAQILFPLFDSTACTEKFPGTPSVPRSLRGTGGGGQSPGAPFIGRSEMSGEQAPARHHIVLAPVDSPRAASLDELLAAARALDVPAHPAATAAEALTLARQLTPPDGLIVVTGSIYLVGAIRSLAGDIAAAANPNRTNTLSS